MPTLLTAAALLIAALAVVNGPDEGSARPGATSAIPPLGPHPTLTIQGDMPLEIRRRREREMRRLFRQRGPRRALHPREPLAALRLDPTAC